jgi:HK97 family phage prohead protease
VAVRRLRRSPRPAKGLTDAAAPEESAAARQAAESAEADHAAAGESVPAREVTEAVTEFRYIVSPIERVEVRDPSGNGDNTWTMSGYAAVFDQQTTLYDGRFTQINEQIDRRAFDTVMRDQAMGEPSGVVHFNFGHDMNRAVAATNVPAGQPGSLQLSVDSQGLYFLAKVPRDDPDGVALAAKMRSGVVAQSSFAFTIDGIDTAESTDEETGRTTYSDTITEVGHLYDVCACSQGAYSSTVSGLRTYARQLGRPSHDEADRPREPETADLADATDAIVRFRPGVDDFSEVVERVRAIAARFEPIAAPPQAVERDEDGRTEVDRLWASPGDRLAQLERDRRAEQFARRVVPSHGSRLW